MAHQDADIENFRKLFTPLPAEAKSKPIPAQQAMVDHMASIPPAEAARS